jgi:hypothetical protein
MSPTTRNSRDLTATDRDAMLSWIGTRVAVVVLSLGTLWTVVGGPSRDIGGWLSRGWDHWDTGLFVKVARFGYQGYPAHYPDHGIVAFFPGEPLLLRVVHLFVRNWIASGLLISLAAGAVACVALGRLGVLESGRLAGERAPLYLALSPYAVFLFAVYSESLFLAFALPAWLSARRGRWVLAGVLAGFAASVRITGLFLGLALLVAWALDSGADRRWRDMAPLLLPFAVIAGYMGYVRSITGDWFGWQHAQEDYWGRKFTAPWTALHTTWNAATDPNLGAAYEWSFRAEIVAIGIGVVLCVVLLLRRRWAELVYVGGQVVALGTSSYYLSIARTTLLWWPLWLLLAQASVRRRWVHAAYLAVAPALMALMVVTFVQGNWVD